VAVEGGTECSGGCKHRCAMDICAVLCNGQLMVMDEREEGEEQLLLVTCSSPFNQQQLLPLAPTSTTTLPLQLSISATMSDQRVWKEQICCIGAGYVGGPTMAVIAKHCPDIRVAVVDIDERRINAWNSDALPVFEPHLAETLAAARANNNLIFTCNIDEEIDRADIIFVAVATPTKNYGRGAGKAFDMTYWDAVARNIARVATRDKIIVEKSTVPVRTAENVIKILNANRRSKDIKFHVCCLLACLFVCLFVEPAGSMPHC
jgi:hypothetical protein